MVNTPTQSRWFIYSQAGHLYLGDVQIASDEEQTKLFTPFTQLNWYNYTLDQ
jgi:hypothetical protein